MTLAIPILIIIASNVLYNLFTKSMPADANPFAALVVTYLSAAAVAFLLLLGSNHGKSLGSSFGSVNWTSVALGFAIVWLEFGYIRAYRVGWNISTCSLVANIALAVILLIIGVLAYRERLAATQIFGMVLCVAGLFFINKH
ncbi:hypothetical protein [Marasmitruncus massiliensis]|uniref:hypothetical protein n=1 Tax=Marasmitruncus massiliensis TaxID=1944642 RepID=UPI000C7B4AC3|nr:hypothetical protein [Marasmitruncus massiliensis]